MAQVFEYTDKRCMVVLSSSADEDGTIHFATANMTPDLITLSTMSNVVEPTTLELTPEAMNTLVEWWDAFQSLIEKAKENREAQIASDIEEAERLIAAANKGGFAYKLSEGHQEGTLSLDIGDSYMGSFTRESALDRVKRQLARDGLYEPTEDEEFEWSDF